MAFSFMAYMFMAYIVMAYTIMACIVMAYTVMAYIVMALWRRQTLRVFTRQGNCEGELHTHARRPALDGSRKRCSPDRQI